MSDKQAAFDASSPIDALKPMTYSFSVFLFALRCVSKSESVTGVFCVGSDGGCERGREASSSVSMRSSVFADNPV